MKHWALIFLTGFGILISNSAFSNVYISDQQSLIIPVELNIRPMVIKAIPISSENMQADFSISGYVQHPLFPDIIVRICDEPNLHNLENRHPFTCINSLKQKGQFSLKGSTYSSNAHYLVFDNSYSNFTKKYLSAEVSIEVKISQSEKMNLAKNLEAVQTNLYSVFDVPKFDITLKPCGHINAYSEEKNGNITICSETFMEALSSKKTGMIGGILLHELGHTLLNLWGLPNYNNERTADEFATVFLLMNHGDNLVKDWIGFFEENQNIQGEVRGIAASGDQHPLSIQRVAAIKAIIAKPSPVIKRWNKVLYPHMTDGYLNAVISSPYKFIDPDPELAKKELNSRNFR